MNRAIRIHSFGAPDVMTWEPVSTPDPGEGQVLVRHTAIGLNYLDIYQRQGHYPLPLPSGLGVAGVGIVESIGSGVTDIRPGDRVGYAGVPPGSYAHARLVAADRLVPLPEGIEDAVVAATLQQGVTARFLLNDVYATQPGDTVLFHAAAGGVGSIACQWAKRLGAHVIGTVSSDEKAAHAKAHGCDDVIIYTREKIVPRVAEITAGRGVQVVYDSVGQDTYQDSLASLAMRGTFVSFGSASGPLPPVDVNALAERGSLYLTRPRFVHYTSRREDLLAMASDYFSTLLDGTVRIRVGQRYGFDEVVRAHRNMEARATIGSSVLMP